MNNEISKEKIIELLEFFISKIKNNDLDFSTIHKIEYYWDIVEQDKLYNPYIEPKNELSLWQITQDWEYLMDLLENKRDFIGYDFKYLSVIIRLLDYIHRHSN